MGGTPYRVDSFGYQLRLIDLYIQIQTSGTTSLSGAQTDIIGIVGTSSWGPKNTPLVFGTSAERVAYFGSMQDTPFDLATIASTAILQGASNFVGVRVTDGTDTVGSAPVLPQSENEAYPVLISSKYTGSESNNISFNISTGSIRSSLLLTSKRVPMSRAVILPARTTKG